MVPRTVPDCKSKEWLVVPKPIKGISDETVKGRCWRLSFQDYERELLKNSYNLKFVLRLIKKMRNALNMKCIASYYIKTLFLWKVEQVGVKNKDFWQTSPTVLFRVMLEELHGAIRNKRISYFWNQKNNLIESMKPGVQSVYAENLKSVLDSIQANNVNKILQAILTHEELKHFKCTEFYRKRLPLTNIQSPSHNYKESPRRKVVKSMNPPKAT